jgi:hypothetical protein
MAVLQKIPAIVTTQTHAFLSALAARCLTKDMARRLAAVNWKDFETTAGDPSSVVRRMQQIRETGLPQSLEAINIQERALLRSDLLDAVMQKLHSRMQESFFGCQLELVERDKAGALILCLPKTELVVDTHVELHWSETSKEETAAVFATSILRESSTPAKYDGKLQDIADLTASTVDQVVDALFQTISYRIGMALDIAEANAGIVPNIIELSEGRP